MKYKSVKGLLKSDESLIPVTFIDKLEDILHGFLGILLFIVSILAAGYTLQRLIETRPFFPVGMIQGINDILFVVIILEIMRTVIVRFTDGIFQLDNFLIIGVIAAVRHILTVGASLTMEKEKIELTERILGLFKEGVIKDIMKNKNLSSELAIINGKEIHVIYIADDEESKENYIILYLFHKYLIIIVLILFYSILIYYFV